MTDVTTAIEGKVPKDVWEHLCRAGDKMDPVFGAMLRACEPGWFTGDLLQVVVTRAPVYRKLREPVIRDAFCRFLAYELERPSVTVALLCLEPE
jgi:hypothetical protein